MKAKGTYTVAKWEETTYRQPSSATKMTKAAVEYAMSGEITGKAFVEYLMFYSHFDSADPHKSSARYVGLIAFEGDLAGKKGNFAMEDNGAFENGAASSALRIIPGSGTGELSTIQGSGWHRAGGDGITIELEYRL